MVATVQTTYHIAANKAQLTYMLACIKAAREAGLVDHNQFDMLGDHMQHETDDLDMLPGMIEDVLKDEPAGSGMLYGFTL